MTPKIIKGQFQTGNYHQHLTLVCSACRALDKPSDHSLAAAVERADQQTVRQLTCALICRLQIPATQTIVGLLGVGLSEVLA